MSKVLSIEVGYSQTKICEMDYQVKNPKVYKYVRVRTPQGAVDDGYIFENEELVYAVKRALTENKIKTRNVVFPVSSSKIATREIMLPALKRSQLDSMVKTNASEYFPIDLSDYEVAYLLLGSVKEEGKTDRYKAMVMAAGKTLIEGYDRFATACGLHLVSLDYSGNSIYQIMKNECREDTELVIKVEEKNSVATVITGQNLVLQRNIVYGIDDAINTISRSYVYGEQDYHGMLKVMKKKTCINVVLNEATQIIAEDDTVEELEDLDNSDKISQVKMTATNTLAPLVGNVARVADLYNSKNIEHPIKRVVLIGIGSDIRGLDKLFTNELGIETVVLKELSTLPWNKASGRKELPGNYLTAIGAAFAPVGLISEEKKKTEAKSTNYTSAAVLAGIFFVVASAALVVLSVLQYNEAKTEQQRLQRLEAEYAPAEAVFNSYNSAVALLGEVRRGYSLTKHPNENLLAFLAELEQKLPADAEVKEFSSNDEKAVLTMRVADKEQAAKVIQTLRGFASVMDVSIGTVDKEVVDESRKAAANNNNQGTAEDGEEEQEEVKPGVLFSIVCTYYPISVEEPAAGTAE